MALDTTRIGELAMELMESIAEQHGECRVGEVAVVVELVEDGPAIEEGDPEEGEYGGTTVRYRCSNPKRWVQAGLLREALAAADRK